MDIYYKIKSENLIEDMEAEIRKSLDCTFLEKLDKRGLYKDVVSGRMKGVIESWDDIYRHGIDGYLVNIAVEIIQRGFYNKKKIFSVFKKEVYAPLRRYGCNEDSLRSVFDKIWQCKYSMGNNNVYRQVMDYALLQQPMYLRLLNSNVFLVVFLVLFLVAAYFIGDCFTVGHMEDMSLFMALSVLWVGVIASARKIILFPIISLGICIGVCLYHVLFTDEYIIFYAKRSLWIGLSFLLWYPILLINRNRLADKYFLK